MLMTSSMTLIESLASDVAATDTGKTTLISAYGVQLLSGPRPTKAQIQASIYTYAGNDVVYDGTLLTNLQAQLGGKLVISMRNPALVLPVTWTHDRFSLAFSEITDQTASLQDDAPTWGLIYLFHKGGAAASSIGGWTPRVLLYFTVGDENSDADMKIKGGFIPKGTPWRINDVDITITGGIK